MSSIYTTTLNSRTTPANQQVPGRPDQIQNASGGFVFGVNQWTQLDRFLIIGSEGGGYYVSEQKLTAENAQSVVKCVKDDGIRAVNRIHEISNAGRAPKNTPAIFALAVAAAHGDRATQHKAFQVLPKVARTGTDFFMFNEIIKGMRGRGRAVHWAMQNWYLSKSADDAAYQMIKYRNRNNWTHKDMLKLYGLNCKDLSGHKALYDWAVHDNITEDLPSIVHAFLEIQKLDAKNKSDLPRMIELIKAHNLPWEALPTEALNSADLWDALLGSIKLRALLRNLNRLSELGLTDPFGSGFKIIKEKFSDATLLKRERLHPINILIGLKQYASGKSAARNRVQKSWNVNQQIVGILDDAFYAAFDNVESTGQNHLVAVDCSASMTWPQFIASGLQAREIAAAMALLVAKTEPNSHIVGYGQGIQDILISSSMRLDQAVSAIGRINMGATDCSLPMLHAQANKWPIDVFVSITDCETNTGRIQPFQALRQYRGAMSRPAAKLAVLATSPNRFSIADPNDPGMLDIAGFDTSVPNVLRSFALGEF